MLVVKFKFEGTGVTECRHFSRKSFFDINYPNEQFNETFSDIPEIESTIRKVPAIVTLAAKLPAQPNPGSIKNGVILIPGIG